MLKAIQSFLGGSRNERELKRIWPIVDQINEIAESLKELSDDELRGKTASFREALREAVAEIEAELADVKAELRGARDEEEETSDGRQELSIAERHDVYAQLDNLEKEWLDVTEATLDEILPEAFAVIKETCRRMVGKEWEAGGAVITWDMVPYDVQLLGSVVLHKGRIAEMKTGEGKTLVAVASIYLNALVGRGVHVVTVNPYLAKRDAEWMGPIYEFHGLKVDCVDAYEPHSTARRNAYLADVTYGTNNEFGFDYLRDNSFVSDPEQLVQRPHHFAIVDEVDSVLIDEARTPLIISGPVPQADSGPYEELKPFVEKLVFAQQKLVAQFVSQAEKLLNEKAEGGDALDRKRVSELDEEAGLALLRAQRGYPRNKKLIKLKSETGVEQLLRKTEYYYLQDNARNMPFVDEELYFALDEKQHSIEMTEKGRAFVANSTGKDPDFFIIPDLGEEIARLEDELETRVVELREELDAQEGLTDEKRQNKFDNDRRVLRNEMDDRRRTLYSLYSERSERIHSVNQLLRAYTLFEKDVEYIVQEGKVMIVDVHTGRVLSGRRYSDGLHEAIEAKEDVKVETATQTYATITLQNYFRLYSKLAGMTGTAETEASEFYEIYKLDVNVIPTNEPIARDDLEDLVFRSKREKYNAAIDKIREYHEKGQPVLVGTTSVEVSETLSRMLKRSGIQHNVLNAKRDRAKSEALIVAEAGRKSAVTIATNMAGRGTDIKLGPGVTDLGGLAILGTERHESRRIDLQLRGRSGRQGDPGESQFYVSLEDDLMRLFGSDRTARIMDRMGLQEGEVITHRMVTKSIERAQAKVEQNNFAIRKRQLEYDDVLNAQREVIYSRRMHALKGDRLHADILDMLQDVVAGIVEKYYGAGDIDGLRDELLRILAFDFTIDRETFVQLGEDGVIDRVYEAVTDFYRAKRRALARPFHNGVKQILESDLETKPEKLHVQFTDGRKLLRAVCDVQAALETDGHEVNDALERVAVMATIDEKWTDHLRELDELKSGIGLRAFGQKDPLLEYKMEAFKLFQQMIEDLNQDSISLVMRAGPLAHDDRTSRDRPPAAARAQRPASRLDQRRATASHETSQGYGVKMGNVTSEGGGRRDPTTKAQPVVTAERVGRNDPCPCGSGKKYKHCHGRS